MNPLTDTQKELYESLWSDLRGMYQRDIAMADNGIPFRGRMEDFIKELQKSKTDMTEIKTVKDIVVKYLKDNAFDGLKCDVCECILTQGWTCKSLLDCRPAYKGKCTCGGNCKFDMYIDNAHRRWNQKRSHVNIYRTEI